MKRLSPPILFTLFISLWIVLLANHFFLVRGGFSASAYVPVAAVTGGIGLLMCRQVWVAWRRLENQVGRFAEALNLQTHAPLPLTIEAIYERVHQWKKELSSLRIDAAVFHQLFSKMKEMVILIDSSGDIVSMNRAAETFIGFNSSESSGKPFDAVFRNPSLVTLLKEVESEGQGKEHEIKMMLPGSELEHGYFWARISPLLLPEEPDPWFLVIMEDLTVIKRLEGVRRDFIANVSHEIKTPITAIRGYVETLLEEGIIEEDIKAAKGFLEVIVRQSERLNNMVDALLLLARIEEYDRDDRQWDAIDLSFVVERAVETVGHLADAKGVIVENHLPKLPLVKGDAHLLEMAVANILINAIQYSNDGKKVEIHGEARTGEVVISVTDYGIGISKDEQARIFERFYRVEKGRSRSSGGTGLGLSIVKQVVRLHGGRVWVESIPGQGSTFHISISSIT